MIKQITKAQDMLDILEPIPEDMFITDTLYEPFNKSSGKCCSWGHINKAITGNPGEKVFDVNILTRQFLEEKHQLLDKSIAEVNDRPNINGYTEPVIKDRVIHLLKDMIRDGY